MATQVYLVVFTDGVNEDVVGVFKSEDEAKKAMLRLERTEVDVVEGYYWPVMYTDYIYDSAEDFINQGN